MDCDWAIRKKPVRLRVEDWSDVSSAITAELRGKIKIWGKLPCRDYAGCIWNFKVVLSQHASVSYWADGRSVSRGGVFLLRWQWNRYVPHRSWLQSWLHELQKHDRCACQFSFVRWHFHVWRWIKKKSCFKPARLCRSPCCRQPVWHVSREQRPPTTSSRPDKCRVESGKASGIELRNLNMQMVSWLLWCEGRGWGGEMDGWVKRWMIDGSMDRRAGCGK